jgi:hypothetical protein
MRLQANRRNSVDVSADRNASRFGVESQASAQIWVMNRPLARDPPR